MTEAQAPGGSRGIPHLALIETPSTWRFLMSDGTTIDISGHNNMAARLVALDGRKDVKVEGVTTIERGACTGASTVAAWEPTVSPEPKKSSGTSTKRSTNTTRRTRVRTKSRSK